jgi:uncharacterized protein (TIRG00374 family)
MGESQISFQEVGPVSPSPGRRSFLYLRVGVALILIFLILWWVDFKVVMRTILKTDLRYMVLIVALALFDRYLTAYKWNMLLKVRGIVLSNFEAFKIYLSSGFVGTFLPSTVGGDVVRVLRTKMSGGKFDQITASVLVERIIGLLAAALLAVLALTFLVSTQETRFREIYYFAWFFLVTLVCCLIISVQPRMFNLIKRALARFERFKLVRMYLDLHSAYMELSKHWKVLVLFGILSLFRHGVLVLMNFFGARALGLPIAFEYVLAIIPVCAIVLLLPISINAIGLNEGAFIFLFGLAGLTAEESLSLSLFMRVFQLLLLIPAGLVFLYDSVKMKKS